MKKLAFGHGTKDAAIRERAQGLTGTAPSHKKRTSPETRFWGCVRLRTGLTDPPVERLSKATSQASRVGSLGGLGLTGRGRLRMLLRYLALMILLLSQHVAAFEFPIQITEYLDDKKIIAFINEGDIDEALHWEPESAPPPLSMVGAFSAVRKTIDADGKLPAAELTEIELEQIPHHPRQWHYLVKMTIRDNGESTPGYFVVLMNAKVIPALPRPEPLR